MQTTLKINMPILSDTTVYAVVDLTKVCNNLGLPGTWVARDSYYAMLDPRTAKLDDAKTAASKAGLENYQNSGQFDGQYQNTVMVPVASLLSGGLSFEVRGSALFTRCVGADQVKRVVQLLKEEFVSFVKLQPNSANVSTVPYSQLVFAPSASATRMKILILGDIPPVLIPHVRGEANVDARGCETWGIDKVNSNIYDHYVPSDETSDRPRIQFDWPVVQDMADPGDLKDNRPCFDIVSVTLPESGNNGHLEYAFSSLRSGGVVVITGSRRQLNWYTWDLGTHFEQFVNLSEDAGWVTLLAVKRSKKKPGKTLEKQLLDGWLDEHYRVDLKNGQPMVQQLSLISPWSMYPPEEVTAVVKIKQADYSPVIDNPVWCLMAKDKTQKIPKEDIDTLGIKKVKSFVFSYEVTPSSKKEKEKLDQAVKDNDWDMKLVPVEVKVSPGTDGRGNPIPVELPVLKEAGFTDLRRGWDGEAKIETEPERLGELKALADREGWEMLVRGEKVTYQAALDTRKMPVWTPGPGKPLLLTGVVDETFMSRFINSPPFPEVEAHGAESEIVFPVEPSPANVMKLFDHLTPRIMTNKAGKAELVFGCSVPVTETVQTMTDAGWPCKKSVTRPIAKLIRFVLEGDDTGLIIESNVG